ncbi:NAD(P)H-hydrate epimerase [Roseimicrobium gellanilyticum]|uniref:ADP-dependent (S)-NAD(P)H-hydrate dehydratase n=1 Tax=Roseimicrobium gellanilyticum TaxID=748857 RepID=A0A366HPI6_9BACT|nr:NAD(P)H-hydrate dehydratase [Roseimicrobium gellanilyticum]RBP45405.1 NAD(P)H-hydrate epimerase [Roseimicrobium gellanilyticum]
MIVSCAQMLEGERVAFARGVSAADLMEEAARGIFEAIRQFHPQPGTAVLYLGKGNNAGDALVVGRLMLDSGWKVLARPVGEVAEFKELPAKHWQVISDRVPIVADLSPLYREPGALVLVDGILGIGASPSPLKGAYAAAVGEMNALRRARHAFTVAIDLPSGLNPTADAPSESACVEADLTVTVAHAKDVLLADGATKWVGRLAIAPLAELESIHTEETARVITSRDLLPELPCRSFDFHKGQAGRVGIVAGSRGFVGAALLTATAALRGGAGLITLYVMEEDYSIFAAQAPLEVMVKPVADYLEVLANKHDALAIGPGLGKESQERILEIIQLSEAPMVLDADALNMLAEGHLDLLKTLKAPALLTPHPGEMQRLTKGGAHVHAGATRREQAEKMSVAFPGTTWLLKGSRTVIATQDQATSFNTTGQPGMATGGMGDVLTGLCAALMGQGLSLHEGACLGAWLSGRSAERAMLAGQSAESLSPGDVLAHLGEAFTDLKRGVF